MPIRLAFVGFRHAHILGMVRHASEAEEFEVVAACEEDGATRAALRLVREEGWRRDHLQALVRRFRDGAAQLGLALADSTTPIQPLIIGEAVVALRWSEALRARGLLISAIRPPTVPLGSARLRITLSAAHSTAQVDRLLDALEQLMPLHVVKFPAG